MVKIVKADDIEVPYNKLGKTARSIIKSLDALDTTISEKLQLDKVLQKAHDAYIQDLKQEMLRGKAGLEF